MGNLMETKEIIRNYWDHRSEIYSTGIVEYSEEEGLPGKYACFKAGREKTP